MVSRLKQIHMYLFVKFNNNDYEVIKKILPKEEFDIFYKMSNYDQLHSFSIYNKCLKNNILKNDENYLKLALLHDCGKGNIGLFKRIKKVIVGDKELEQHSNNGYSKLKNININVAKLCKIHHDENVDDKMKIFQQIDDE